MMPHWKNVSVACSCKSFVFHANVCQSDDLVEDRGLLVICSPRAFSSPHREFIMSFEGRLSVVKLSLGQVAVNSSPALTARAS